MIERIGLKALAAITLCAIGTAGNAAAVEAAAADAHAKDSASRVICVKDRVTRHVGAPGKRLGGSARARVRRQIVEAADGTCPGGTVRYVAQTRADGSLARRTADQEAGE